MAPATESQVSHGDKVTGTHRWKNLILVCEYLQKRNLSLRELEKFLALVPRNFPFFTVFFVIFESF